MFDFVSGSQLWTKTEPIERFRAVITQDGNLVGLVKMFEKRSPVRLVNATTGKVMAKAPENSVDAGFNAIRVGERLYESGAARQLGFSATQQLPDGRWVHWNGTDQSMFTVIDRAGDTQSSELFGYPVNADANGIISSWNGAMTEYNLTTGAQRWTVRSELFEKTRFVMLSDRYVTFGDDDFERTWVIDRTTGAMRDVPGEVLDVEGTKAMIREPVKTLRRIDLSTDKVEWKTDVRLEYSFQRPFRVGGSLIGFTAGSEPIFAIRVNDGTVAWRRDPNQRPRVKLLRTEGDDLLVVVMETNSTTLELFDSATGATKWTTSVPITGADAAVGGTRVAITGSCSK